MNSASKGGRLSESELLAIWKEDISTIAFRNAEIDEAPVSIWLGGQPGAGKSSAAKSACRFYPNKSIVVIDGDEYRQYHPQYVEVMRTDSSKMPDITQQAEGRWIAMSVDHALSQGYSSLIEGTWRDSEVVLRETRRAKKRARKIHAFVVAVSPIESAIGILRRYIDARSVGRSARWTSPVFHDDVIKKLPENVRTIAMDESVDIFSVMERDGTVRLTSANLGDREETVSRWRSIFERKLSFSEKREMRSELTLLVQLFYQYEPENRVALDYLKNLMLEM